MSLSTKQRRSRARRRAGARCLGREVELAGAGEEPVVVVLLATKLVTVFELHGDGGVETCLAGPGAPWGPGRAARC